VLLSAGVVLIGLILYFAAPHPTSLDLRVFKGERADLRNVRGILHNALELNGSGVIQFGLLLLLATPIARVALSVLAFACQRDKVYVLVTLIVLSILAYSLAGGSL
jgi:uncharacterized membrane protein